MRIFQKKIAGFSLIEIMIVVAIIAILSVVGGITLNSRLAASRLETAASTLSSDLRAARSSAMFKGCPTRFIICADKTCSTASGTGRNISAQTSASGNYLGTASGPALYYGVLRMSQKESSSSTCYNTSAINSLDSPTDSYNYWDFDRRPQSIPRGVVFTSVYSPVAFPNFATDWSTSTDAAASNSVWFSSSSGTLTAPTGGATASNGDPIAFQVSLESCDPRDTSSDCIAYLITVGAGGVVKMVKCSAGGRSPGATLSDQCF